VARRERAKLAGAKCSVGGEYFPGAGEGEGKARFLLPPPKVIPSPGTQLRFRLRETAATFSPPYPSPRPPFGPIIITLHRYARGQQRAPPVFTLAIARGAPFLPLRAYEPADRAARHPRRLLIVRRRVLIRRRRWGSGGGEASDRAPRMQMRRCRESGRPVFRRKAALARYGSSRSTRKRLPPPAG